MPWAKIIPAGAAVDHFGGRIGLSGAKFRLPLLIGLFGFAALEAVILNKATSLIVEATALPFRWAAFPLEDVFAPVADHRKPAGRKPVGRMAWGGLGGADAHAHRL